MNTIALIPSSGCVVAYFGNNLSPTHDPNLAMRTKNGVLGNSSLVFHPGSISPNSVWSAAGLQGKVGGEYKSAQIGVVTGNSYPLFSGNSLSVLFFLNLDLSR